MTDIVERLRSSLQLHGPHLLRNADIAEAADEIERLRALVKEARQYVSDAGDDEDGETQKLSAALLADIDRALAPTRTDDERTPK